jgi:hypothetical protein
MQDNLELIVHDLRVHQLDALIGTRPDAFTHYFERMSRATTEGLAIVNEMAIHRPELRTLMSQIVSLAETDRRLGFLDGIPEGPLLAVMRARALERAIFDIETEEVARIALLIGIFTVLLDGVIDEAPEIFATIQPWLDQTMNLASPPPEPPANLHPVAQAIVWSATSAISGLAKTTGWRDPTARAEFVRATKAAYQTELVSTTCLISDRSVPPGEMRKRIADKSTACIWAGALIPMVVHGWPEGIDPAGFEELARTVGAFSGWIDDIVDLGIDLRADRWSMPLLEIYDLVTEFDPGVVQRSSPGSIVYDGLLHPWIGKRLPGLGVLRWQAVCGAMEALGMTDDVIVPVMADVARAALLDGLVPA